MSLAGPAAFTPRQRQIIQLIASGDSNDEIAEQLGISERTVRAHCEALRRKLQCLRRRHIPFAYRQSTGADPLATSDVI
jgi:DNA-binding CsgD family transcriptional regulator